MYLATIDIHPGNNQPWQVLAVTKMFQPVQGVRPIEGERIVNVTFDLPEQCPCPSKMSPSDEWLRDLALLAYGRCIQPKTETIELTYPVSRPD